ncbi:MAG: alpha/beta hydrolase [Deltaproteobacteria bacterium]|nr:alpha/beta hydrolase [Deltaproteobacteria bacterium]
MVHGFTCSHEDWRYQLDYFQKSHRVIAPDLRCHGRSSCDLPSSCTIKNCADDLQALLKALNLKDSVLIGHSIACRVVLQTYLEAADRIAALVLMEGSKMPGETPEAGKESATRQIEAVGYKAFLQQGFAAMFLPRSSPRLVREIVDRSLAFPEEAGRTLWIDHGGWDAQYLEEALSGLRVPLLLLQSTKFVDDKVRIPLEPGEISPWMEFVRRHVPSVKIKVIPNTGHFLMLEAPGPVNIALEGFLTALGMP